MRAGCVLALSVSCVFLLTSSVSARVAKRDCPILQEPLVRRSGVLTGNATVSKRQTGLYCDEAAGAYCPLHPNRCMEFVCIGCQCYEAERPGGWPCDDGKYCTRGDVCGDYTGICRGGLENPCSGGNVCNNQCNEADDNCFSPSTTSCTTLDGLFCNGADWCDGAGSCSVHAGNPCLNNPECGQRVCSETSDACLFVYSGTKCTDDTLFCNGNETCDGAGTCAHSGNPCQYGTACNNTCNENAETCFSSSSTPCTSDNNQCTDDKCNGVGRCEHRAFPDGTDCQDASSCTGPDTCQSGTCVAGPFTCGCQTHLDCNDNNACTADTCIIVNNVGSCSFSNVADDTVCDDNVWCNGDNDKCFAGNCRGEFSSPSTRCSNGNACNNICNEGAQNCLAPANTACANGQYCDGVDTCDGAGTCVSAGDPCVNGPVCANVCDESADSCSAANGTKCSNGVFCDGEEVCMGGICEAGEPPCPPGTPCSSTCNEAEKNCFAPRGTNCNDNLWCNGNDICSDGACLHTGAPCEILSRNFKNSCLRTCNETAEECMSPVGTSAECYDTINRTDCADGVYCNGLEVCDGVGGIRSPGNPCRGDCDPVQGVCVGVLAEAVAASSESAAALPLPIFLGVGVGLLLCCLLIAAVFLLARRSGGRKGNSGVELEALPSRYGSASNGGSGGATPISANAAYSGLPDSCPLIDTPSEGHYGPVVTPKHLDRSDGLSPELSAMVAASPHSASTTAWRIPFDQLIVKERVGSGSFGTVYGGSWRGGSVAVKTIQGEHFTQKDLDEFLSEAEVMSGLRPHSNVVAFYGVSFGSIGVCIVTEFLQHGSLENLLLDETVSISPVDQLQWIRGMASGMQHLAAERIVHRDLAARNLLLGENRASVKIADFGMARTITETGGSNATKSNTGPLKHMAVECLLHRQYSSKSDVWAFAITSAEILTRAEPYPHLDAVGAATQVTHGLRVEYPANIDQTLLGILTSCMATDPAERPEFWQLLEWLENVPSAFS